MNYSMNRAPYRLDWVDQIRGILFILVIVCHSRLAEPWMKYLYEPIFLTGFFFISGYLYRTKLYLARIKSIINTLVVPLVLYSAIWGVISLLQTRNLLEGINSFALTILGGDTIWFIPCLILVEFGYVSLEYLFKDYVNAVAIILSVICMFILSELGIQRGVWSWEVATYAIGYFALGNACKDRLLTMKWSVFLGIIYTFLSLSLGLLGYLDGIDMHLNTYGHVWAYLLTSVIGCFALISLSQYFYTNKYIIEFGKYTLLLFPFHGIVLRKVLVLSRMILSGGGSFICLVISVLVTFFICLLVARFVYKYIPLLGGKIKVLK